MEGKSVPPLDPALIIAGVLLAASIVGLAFVLAGGAPPRVNPATGRRAILVAGALGTLVAAALALTGVGA